MYDKRVLKARFYDRHNWYEKGRSLSSLSWASKKDWSGVYKGVTRPLFRDSGKVRLEKCVVPTDGFSDYLSTVSKNVKKNIY